MNSLIKRSSTQVPLRIDVRAHFEQHLHDFHAALADREMDWPITGIRSCSSEAGSGSRFKNLLHSGNISALSGGVYVFHLPCSRCGGAAQSTAEGCRNEWQGQDINSLASDKPDGSTGERAWRHVLVAKGSIMLLLLRRGTVTRYCWSAHRNRLTRSGRFSAIRSGGGLARSNSVRVLMPVRTPAVHRPSGMAPEMSVSYRSPTIRV